MTWEPEEKVEGRMGGEKQEERREMKDDKRGGEGREVRERGGGKISHTVNFRAETLPRIIL